MSEKTFIAVTGILFGIIAILHLVRIIYGWPAQIGTFMVSPWVSWFSLLVAAYLAASAFILLRKWIVLHPNP
jgi:hypothetical protein